MVNPDVRDLFITVTDLDEVYAQSINRYMCTDFCICPGTPADEWVKAYNELPDALYSKYKRAKVGHTGKIDLTNFFDASNAAPLFWSYDPTTKESKKDLVDLASESFVACADNSEKITETFKAEKEKETGLTAGQRDLDTESFRNAGKSVKASKPDEKYIKFIEYIEKEYECSGLCSPSMFYFANSVKTGPPKQGCLAPFIDDLTDLAGNLGEAMVASAVFFLFMSILIWVLCCYKHKKATDKVEPFEGGVAIEMENH